MLTRFPTTVSLNAADLVCASDAASEAASQLNGWYKSPPARSKTENLKFYQRLHHRHIMASQGDIPLDELSQDLLELCEVHVHFIDPNSNDERLEPIAKYPIARFLEDGFDFLGGLKAIEPCKEIDSSSTELQSFHWIHVPVNNLAWVEVSVPATFPNA